MDINTIYASIFPIGGIDDNNRYSELTGDKINSVQVVEPALGVSEFLITKKDLYDKNNQPYKYAYRIPLIAIEDLYINNVDLTAFKLDYTGFIPTLSFDFVDSQNNILTTNVPKDGAIIRIYIGGLGDELYYKPIRQDFVLTSIRKIAGQIQNRGGISKYRVYGKLNVPYGYRKESWSGGVCSARQSLFNLAIWTGLGFATNFTNPNMLDTMKWINNATGTYFDFMEDIAGHACYSPNTFFTAFIDQYNVLNFVECHSLLSHAGEKTDTPAMMYKCYPPQALPEFVPGSEKTTKNQLPLDSEEDDFDNVHQKLTYYYISNNDKFDGWTNYIEDYHEISNNSSSMSEGFRTHVTYTDSNVDESGIFSYDFLIRPVDNLKRDATTQEIQELPDEVNQDSYIPLNLMQMTKDEYLEDLSSVDNMTNVESFNNYGEVDTTNMFKQYFFAEVQNRYQMKCLKKCGLKVRLQNYNPAITKFSRIWVDIYDKNIASQLEKTDINKNIDKRITGDYLTYVTEQNENILNYEGEGVHDHRGKYNRGLSGWYVVTEIDIEYSPKDVNLKMNLTLNRIEYKPAFKSDYERAKKSVKKYKDENKMTDILINI